MDEKLVINDHVSAYQPPADVDPPAGQAGQPPVPPGIPPPPPAHSNQQDAVMAYIHSMDIQWQGRFNTIQRQQTEYHNIVERRFLKVFELQQRYGGTIPSAFGRPTRDQQARMAAGGRRHAQAARRYYAARGRGRGRGGRAPAATGRGRGGRAPATGRGGGRAAAGRGGHGGRGVPPPPPPPPPPPAGEDDEEEEEPPPPAFETRRGIDSTAKLCPRPRSLFELWEEYLFGIGTNKPAKNFTSAERNNRDNGIKQKWYRRNKVWKLQLYLIERGGYSAHDANNKIYQHYNSIHVTHIIRGITKDERTYKNLGGVHPNLRLAALGPGRGPTVDELLNA